jgi:hypothetical protein
MFPFQADIVRWALRRGRAAIFAGTGSEGYASIRLGRKFVGIELKPAYYKRAVANLHAAERDLGAGDLLSGPTMPRPTAMAAGS